jgi:hypothetical protein
VFRGLAFDAWYSESHPVGGVPAFGFNYLSSGPTLAAVDWLGCGVSVLKYLFICRDPIGRDITLRCFQLNFSLANQLMEVIFELVLCAGIPGRRVRLRPEIPNTVDSTQPGGNQIVQANR